MKEPTKTIRLERNDILDVLTPAGKIRIIAPDPSWTAVDIDPIPNEVTALWSFGNICKDKLPRYTVYRMF